VTPAYQDGRVTIADLAYCAGVIDSDGTIGVKKSTYAMRVRRDAGQPTYSERVSVKQVEPHAVSLLVSLFGGSRYITNNGTKNARPLHAWLATDQRAATALSAVLPYLRIKRLQAENCLQLRALKEASKIARVANGRGHIGAASRPADLSQAMEHCLRRAHLLNAVGKEVSGGDGAGIS